MSIIFYVGNVPKIDFYLPKDIDEVDEVVEDDDSFLISTILLVGDDSIEGEVGGGEHG